MAECLPIVEQLQAAGVPEPEQLKFHEVLDATKSLPVAFSFSALLSLWLKYKDNIPAFWQFIQDVIAALKDSAPPAPAPAPGANDPFAGG